MNNTTDEPQAVETVEAAPAEVAPIEGTVLPAAMPVPAPEPDETDDDLDEDERPEGIPAAHLAAGGLSSAAVTLGSLYQLLGLPGLIGGAVLSGGGAIAYVRHRHQRRQRSTWGVSWEDGKGGRGPGRRSRSGGGGAFGALRSEGRSSRSAGRSTGGGLLAGRKGRSTGGASRSGGAAASGYGSTGRARPAGRGRDSSAATSARSTTRQGTSAKSAQGATRQRGPLQNVRHAAASTGRAARNFGRTARRAGAGTARAVRSSASQVRKGAAWADAKTGDRAGRAYRATTAATRRAARATGRAAASQARRAGAWADRKTGQRVSTAWHATRGAEGFRAARRRAAATLGGWDAQLTATLVALVALLVDRWRARQAVAAEQADKDAQAAAEAAEDGSGDGPRDPALTRVIACPRCKAEHTVTIPADEFDTWIRCGCGLKICVFREPVDPPEHVMAELAEEMAADSGADDRRRPPSTTASPIHTRRNRSVSANPLAAAAAEVNAAAAAHAPADMWDVARELDQLHEVPANIAMAVRTYTMRLQGEYPIDPAVVDAIHQLYQGLAQLVPVAEEIAVMFRTAHAEDLKREEAPRTNEQMWDVGRI
ncbi:MULTISPECIES: hypothetical protein [Streptosporangium]|uniref:Uncharacterized protein n=1 Tax=Streptosporangium brasiliense TaxID=47480 RepID=A0ABT9RQ33_9ACTN|nr:hypothetical protein [Streptosporangium brasiliense]MDP9870475.1 hypothetical protein [Streptosporangium brasiliense]